MCILERGPRTVDECFRERTQDRFIEHLMKEVERLKAELVSQKAEGAMMMESLQTRIQQLEMELSEMKQIAESTSQVR